MEGRWWLGPDASRSSLLRYAMQWPHANTAGDEQQRGGGIDSWVIEHRAAKVQRQLGADGRVRMHPGRRRVFRALDGLHSPTPNLGVGGAAIAPPPPHQMQLPGVGEGRGRRGRGEAADQRPRKMQVDPAMHAGYRAVSVAASQPLAH